MKYIFVPSYNEGYLEYFLYFEIEFDFFFNIILSKYQFYLQLGIINGWISKLAHLCIFELNDNLARTFDWMYILAMHPKTRQVRPSAGRKPYVNPPPHTRT